jgi:hypothetical protein
MPLDLREAYERGKWLGETYGDVVDVWEIDNEPDIGFGPDNPETYAAFLKAVYLGLKSGADASFRAGEKPEFKLKGRQIAEGQWLERKRGWSSLDRPRASPVRRDSRVIMAPLALPPGPYLERLWNNGVASYTDGFNFHYYGYAEDFTGVYRQFEDAVTRLSALAGRNPKARRAALDDPVSRTESKQLPVFITEYGYGLLDADSRAVVAGRVRQWRWFADVVKQVHALRPEGPMAFLWNPYYEADLNEFGLTMSTPAKLAPDGRRAGWMENRKAEELGNQMSGQLAFSPTDFGSERNAHWMHGIGKKVGEWHASPALAYLWDFAQRNPYRPRAWKVKAPPPSPVVIDLIAGTDMIQDKSSGGYRLAGVSTEWTPQPVRNGRARLILYNFSHAPITGELKVSEPSLVTTAWDKSVTLAPGERRELPVQMAVLGDAWRATSLHIEFVPQRRNVSPAVFATRLYPATYGMTGSTVMDFTFTENTRRHAMLQRRLMATGEPPVYPAGRWLVSDGVRVEETGEGTWRFHVDYLPAEPLRPAVVELPLPEGFTFEGGTLLTLERRLGHVEWAGRRAEDGKSEVGGTEGGVIDPARLKSRAGKAGDMMDVYFRTTNGNLYQTWPRLGVTPVWRQYREDAANFTMGFFGRAELPWRLSDNTPAALVFFLRPAQLPAVFEVRDVKIVRLQAE